MTVENVKENQGSLGKLKPVGKVRKEFTCSDCSKDFPIGSPCYDQSDYRGGGFFPIKRRLCVGCGQKQIDNGVEIKEKKTKPKKLESNFEGCGEDTRYLKPDRSGMWKCGEKAPIVGIMKCEKCGGLKK